MTRQKKTINQKKGRFGKEYFVDELDNRYGAGELHHALRQNQMVDDAAALRRRRAELSEAVADAVVTAKYLPTDSRAQIAAAGLGLAGAAGAGLQAYSELSSEYAPRDFFSVAGRAVSNLNPFSGAGVGVDPLSEARNNVAQARQLVGSENMLAALADDEIAQMRAEQELAMTPVELEGLNGVQEMIDARAKQLMETPIEKSDGTVGPMAYDQAQRYATEQVAMELRAGQVY